MTLVNAEEGLIIYPKSSGYKYVCIILYGAGGNGYIADDKYPAPAGGGSGASMWIQCDCTVVDEIKFISRSVDSNTTSSASIKTGYAVAVYTAYPGGNSTGKNPGNGGDISAIAPQNYYGTRAANYYSGAMGGTTNGSGSKKGYTSSGSGCNAKGTNIYAPCVTCTYTYNGQYTIVSTGAGYNGIPTNGGGGAGVPANYENAEAYFKGAEGVLAYYYSDSL